MQIDSDEEEGDDAKQQQSDKGKKKAGKRAHPPPPPKDAPVPPPPLPPTPDQLLIKRDYDPKAAAAKAKAPIAGGDQYLISPLTGERIPASQVAEHMRIGLLDPRWVEERDRMQREKAQEEHVYAPGIAIESTLKKFAERRTDIFGIGGFDVLGSLTMEPTTSLGQLFLMHGLDGSAISAHMPVNQRHHGMLWACWGSSAHSTEKPIASAISP
jgi:hypothetical protein